LLSKDVHPFTAVYVNLHINDDKDGLVGCELKSENATRQGRLTKDGLTGGTCSPGVNE
jgi:hypothetical protein